MQTASTPTRPKSHPRRAALCSALALASCLAAQAVLFAQPIGPAIDGEIAVPALDRRVTDLTGTLSLSERQALEQKLAALEREKGSQIAVLIVPTTGPESIEQFSIKVAERWKIGRKGTDDGIILVVAKNDRKLRIEVGYGLEGAVPDATANRIIDEFIAPRFRDGDFAGGIDAGVERLIGIVRGEELPEPEWPRPSADTEEKGTVAGPWIRESDAIAAYIVGGIFLLIAAGMVVAFWGWIQASITIGGIALVGGWVLLGFGWGLGLAIVLIAIILIMTFGDSGGGGSSSRSSSSSSWSSSGSYRSSSSSSSSSSSRSFSGGGGSFGGGGASGSW